MYFLHPYQYHVVKILPVMKCKTVKQMYVKVKIYIT